MTCTASETARGSCERPADAREAPLVDVWCLPLVQPSADVARFDAALSDEERARLERIASSERRDRSRIAWASRRLLLSRALGCTPRDVDIVHPREGAPALVRLDGPYFSLSHSGQAMLFAISRWARVGADIEQVDVNVDVVRLARRFFPSAEAEAIAALPASSARDLFFRLWTGKEALLKGMGGGVPSRLRTLHLVCEGDRRLVNVATESWSVHDLAGIDSYAAAVAVEGEAAIRLHRAIHEVPEDGATRA